MDAFGGLDTKFYIYVVDCDKHIPESSSSHVTLSLAPNF